MGSFNPSFTGIALVAEAVPQNELHNYMFQSFFYWNCLGGKQNQWRVRLQEDMFQSFFYWNCLGGAIALMMGRDEAICFNPSFTGIALVAHTVD